MSKLLINRRTLIAGSAASLLLPGCAARTVTPAGLPATLVWQKLPTVPYKGKQDDIAFGSNHRGWFGNGQGFIYRTDDGGDIWTQVWHQPGTFVRALGGIDDQHAVMGNVGVGSFPNVKDTNPLYRTSDGGASWTVIKDIEGPIPQGICAIEIVQQSFIDRGERASRTIVHAAGRVGGPAHYLRSTDAGMSWRSWDLGSIAAAIFDVKFLGPRIGFLAASSDPELSKARGLILRTDDGGDNWRVVFTSDRPFETVWKLHFPTDRVGYGTVQSYDPNPANVRRFVTTTTDGGRTWSEVPLTDNAKWRSFGIGFADTKLGWVGGNLGGLETRDGGRTWAPVEMGVAVNKIRFVGQGSDRRAFAVGSDVYRLDLG